MKTKKTMILGILTLFAVSGSGALSYAADTAIPEGTEIQQQAETLHKRGKEGHMKHRHDAFKKKHHEEMKGVREQYHGQIQALKTQREEAFKSENKEQVKALTDQIQALKKERHEKVREIRAQAKAQKEAMRAEKKN